MWKMNKKRNCLKFPKHHRSSIKKILVWKYFLVTSCFHFGSLSLSRHWIMCTQFIHAVYTYFILNVFMIIYATYFCCCCCCCCFYIFILLYFLLSCVFFFSYACYYVFMLYINTILCFYFFGCLFLVLLNLLYIKHWCCLW